MVNGGVFIALGSNLGDRAAHLDAALRALNGAAETRVLRCSQYHETRPVGGPANQRWFLNAVAELATPLSARGLLALMLRIEAARGRVRVERHGPRTLDLDLLLFRDETRDEPGLTLPHPRMWERAFVLEPLRELVGAAGLEQLRAVFGRTAGAPGHAAVA